LPLSLALSLSTSSQNFVKMTVNPNSLKD